MKLLKATVLSLSLLPASAYATGISPLMSPAKIKSEQKLCEGKQKAFSNHVPHFSEMVKKIAWFKDHDYSMEEIDIKEDTIDGKIGRAQITFVNSFGGVSQGVQVCPGVYLSTAHGLLDNPEWAKKQNRESVAPENHIIRASAYPFDNNTLLEPPKNKSQYISPRIRDPENWKKKETDYIFIKFDNPLRPDDFIEPLFVDPIKAIKISDGQKTYLYRGKTIFNVNKDGIPTFKNLAAKNYEDLKYFYKKPRKVKEHCKITLAYLPGEADYFFNTNCPTEKGVSGSPMISLHKGLPFLLGIAKFGYDRAFDKFQVRNGYIGGSSFLSSEQFCTDYKNVCGKPCAR